MRTRVAVLALLAACSAPRHRPPTPALTPTTVAAATSTTTTEPASTEPGCRSGFPLANVYHPFRLQVLDPCRTASGVVVEVLHEEDGDIHVHIRPDSQDRALVNDRAPRGLLVLEIVPADQPGCTPGQPPRPPDRTSYFGTCTGANIATPPVGAHVRATGPYVLDVPNGWNEIHPAWRLEALR